MSLRKQWHRLANWLPAFVKAFAADQFPERGGMKQMGLGYRLVL